MGIRILLILILVLNFISKFSIVSSTADIFSELEFLTNSQFKELLETELGYWNVELDSLSDYEIKEKLKDILISSTNSYEWISIDFSGANLSNDDLAEMLKKGIIPKNTTSLNLTGTGINDVTPLSVLENLQVLRLSKNLITDISPLSNLTNLRNLELQNNRIIDIGPLSNLVKLESISISNNRITDLKPLEKLVSLERYPLLGNPLTNEQIDTFKLNLNSNKEKASNFVKRVLGEEPVTVEEALEILKYLAGMESVVSDGNVAFYAACITGGDEPSIADVLEILKHLAGMKSVFGGGT